MVTATGLNPATAPGPEHDRRQAHRYGAPMSRAGIVGSLLIAGIVALLAVSSMMASGHQCEVCVEYRGRSQCRTVAADTIDLARSGAIQNACAFISGGVTDSMACQRQQPTRERCQ